MKQFLFVLLLVLAPIGSQAQFTYDVGFKLSTYNANRYQLENRFHFSDKVTFLINFGYNRWKMPRETDYKFEDYGTSALIIEYLTIDYYQFKLGLQKNILEYRDAKIYGGFMAGINNQHTKFYHAYCELSYTYNNSTSEPELIYAYPRRVRDMDYIKSIDLKQITGDLFVGVDYAPFSEKLLFTASVHGHFNYTYEYEVQPVIQRRTAIETHIGLRYVFSG